MDALDNVLSIPSIKAEHPNLHADATNELEYIRTQLQKAVEALKYIADYGNYATDGNIETNDGVMHVSNYAAEVLKQVTPVE